MMIITTGGAVHGVHTERTLADTSATPTFDATATCGTRYSVSPRFRLSTLALNS